MIWQCFPLISDAITQGDNQSELKKMCEIEQRMQSQKKKEKNIKCEGAQNRENLQ